MLGCFGMPSAKVVNPQSINLASGRFFLTMAKGSHILHKNIVRIVSMPHTKILPWNLPWGQTSNGPRHSTGFLIQSPKIHISSNQTMVQHITAIPQSLVPISVFVSFYSCEEDSMVSLIKKNINWGWLYFRGFVHYQHGSKHDSMQADMVLEEGIRYLHLDPQAAARESHTGPILSI